ncbi:carbohydrate kinase family protein [Candidatus Babeliales bacterium]|nr:carbohydrate kinase family protein [Candidatus Babeliales bacterium]
MKVTTIGGATHDVFITPKKTTIETSKTKGNPSANLNVPGEKVEVQSLFESTGGGATNSAVSFSRLGFSVSCFCKVGNDNYAKQIKKKLKDENVNTELILTDNSTETGISHIIHTDNGRHVVFAYRGANGKLKTTEFPYASLKNSDFFYITSLSEESASTLLPLCQFAHKHNIPFALNPGRAQLSQNTSDLEEILAVTHILILNVGEAAEVLKVLAIGNTQKPFEINFFFKKMASLGVKYCVVTDGAHGAYVSDNSRVIFHPSLPANVLDTIGAGDSFGSTFSASIINKHSLEESLKRALIASQSVIEKLGAKAGLLTSDQMEVTAKAVNTKNIQEILKITK